VKTDQARNWWPPAESPILSLSPFDRGRGDDADDDAAAVGADDPEAVVLETAPDTQPVADAEPADEPESAPAPEIDPDDETESEYRPASASLSEAPSDPGSQPAGYDEPYAYDDRDDIWSSDSAGEVGDMGFAGVASGVDTLPHDHMARRTQATAPDGQPRIFLLVLAPARSATGSGRRPAMAW
jgi:hypothetical protein